MHRPVFILCPGRSFSSVVCSMLGQHPDLYGVPELNLFLGDTLGGLMHLARRRRSNYMLHGLVRALAELRFGGQTEAGGKQAWGWIDQHLHWSTARVFRDLAERMAPRQCVDKSPAYSAQMDYLKRMHETFPEARYLHLSRHPRATANSQYRVLAVKKAFRPADHMTANPTAVEQHWIRNHSNILEFAQDLPPGQYMRLQGEQLLNDPRTYLPQIVEWLEIRNDAPAMGAMLHPEDSPYAGFGPQCAPCGNNLGFLENPRLRIGGLPELSLRGPLEWLDDEGEFSRHTIELAHQLGYR